MFLTFHLGEGGRNSFIVVPINALWFDEQRLLSFVWYSFFAFEKNVNFPIDSDAKTWKGCHSAKQWDKIWTTYRNENFSSGSEKRYCTVLERQNRKCVFSETHKLRIKNWARQKTRESLTTLRCVAMKGAIAWSRRTVKAFFPLVQCIDRTRLSSTPQELSLGPSD